MSWLLLLLAACTRSDDPPLETRLPQANILMICVDTLRADALGTYAQELPTSPAMDALAQRSVVFERAWTQYTWTLPSFVSYMTSSYARTHGWRAAMAQFETYPRVDDDIPTLATTLRDAGYATNAQVGNGHLTKDLAFDQGFEVWVNGLDKGVLRGALADLKRWAGDGQPNFLYVHFKGPHVALKPSPEAVAALGLPPLGLEPSGLGYESFYSARPEDKPARRELFRQAYLAVVRDTDTRIQQLLEGLTATGEIDHTVVLLFSDHGEMFGVTGQLGHNRSVREEVTQVPLMVAVPGQTPRRVRGAVGRLIDIAPSLLDIVGVPVPAAWQGRSWLERGADPFVVSERDDLVAVTEPGTWRLVVEEGHPPRAFDLSADPHELESREPSPRLVEAEAAWRAATPIGEAGPLERQFSEEERAAETARLKALGYVQ